MKPQRGDIVDYRCPHYNDDEHYFAAIVTHVNDKGNVNLTVFLRNGQTDHAWDIEYGEEEMQWQWPERTGNGQG